MHSPTELNDASKQVATLVLADRLEELVPGVGCKFSAERFFEHAKPALLDWMASRFECESTFLAQAA